jgi:hypothetical protein
MDDAIHYVDANGLHFAYLEEGSGPLVLMLARLPRHRAHLGPPSFPCRGQGIPDGESIHARIPPHRHSGT